jgi:hypothetical protein
MIRSLAVVCLIASFYAAPSLARDIHAFWDSRCGGCHGHAGDFARRYLKVESGKLVGRHHTDNLRLFLGQHEMSGRIDDDFLGTCRIDPTTLDQVETVQQRLVGRRN